MARSGKQLVRRRSGSPGRLRLAWLQYQNAKWGWHVAVPLGLGSVAGYALTWAWTMLDQHEYGVAMLLVAFFLVVGIGAALAIPKRLLKVVALTLVIVVAAFSALKIWNEKGDRQWFSFKQEKPDLFLDLSCDDPNNYHSVIMATFHNHSPLFADNIRYAFVLCNQHAIMREILKDIPDFKPSRDRLPFETLDKISSAGCTHVDSFALPDQWIKGEDKFYLGPITAPQFLKALQQDDPIVGAATITCANCARSRGYWIFFKVGVGGWFAETADGSEPVFDDLVRDVKDKGQNERLSFFTNPEPYIARRPILAKQPICPR